MPIFLVGYGHGGNVALNTYVFNYEEVKDIIKGIVVAETTFRIPNYGKAYKLAADVAMGFLNIFPLKIGIYKPDYYSYSLYKNISQAMD